MVVAPAPMMAGLVGGGMRAPCHLQKKQKDKGIIIAITINRKTNKQIYTNLRSRCSYVRRSTRFRRAARVRA